MSVMAVKEGMMTLPTEKGTVEPVTVLRLCSMKIAKTDKKNIEIAYQVKEKPGKAQSNKALEGHLKRAGIAERGSKLKSFKKECYEALLEDGQAFALGQEIDSGRLLSSLDKIDVSAKTRGRGFQGAVSRWGFSMQRATHGNSLSHRAHGSTGQCQDPGRVFKGKKMAGRDGNLKVTTHNLSVVEVGDDYVLVKGAVPGPKGGVVVIRPAMKVVSKPKKIGGK